MQITLPQFEKLKERAGPFLRLLGKFGYGLESSRLLRNVDFDALPLVFVLRKTPDIIYCRYVEREDALDVVAPNIGCRAMQSQGVTL